MADPDRRTFLKFATGAVGCGVGITVIAPAIELAIDPATKTTVTAPTAPIDIGALGSFAVSPVPRRVDVIAPVIRDGWSAAQNVVLGAAWVRRTAQDKVEALSSICPHLGCAIELEATQQKFLCPCHKRAFALDGANLKAGDSVRGMDSLPIAVKNGRLQLTWIRYKVGGKDKVPA